MQKMKLKILTMILSGFAAFTFLGTFTPLHAKAQPVEVSKIPESQRSWAGIPWIIGGVLVVGAVLVGIKNAKRTHLD